MESKGDISNSLNFFTFAEQENAEFQWKKTWQIIKLRFELITVISRYCFCTISIPDICMFHKKPTVDSLNLKSV